MSKHKGFRLALVALFVSVNLFIFVRIFRIARKSPEVAFHTADEGAIDLASYYRKRRLVHVGDLTMGNYWPKTLQLAEEQKMILARLNDLICETEYSSKLAGAAAYQGSLDDHNQFLETNRKRRNLAYRRARHLVLDGILSEEQAALVTQRYLAGAGHGFLYGDIDEAKDHFDLTRDQMDQLGDIKAGVRAAGLSLMKVAFSGNPNDGKIYNAEVARSREENPKAAWSVLTTEQKARWDRLTVERPDLTRPPDYPKPAPSEAMRLRDEIRGMSPTLRVLGERRNPLGLSTDQEKLLQDLNDVVVHGLSWIGLRGVEGGVGADGTGEALTTRGHLARSRFVADAEQVALLGILSGPQAEKLQTLINRK